MTLAPQLSVQLQWAAQGLQAVSEGQSSTEWLGQCPAALRPGVQAILLSALRKWGLARAVRRQLVPKTPAPAVDSLLCLGLALLAQDPPMYPEHTLVSQAVEAAKKEPRTRALAPLINACLRRYTREHQALCASVQNEAQARYNHPEWWVRQLKNDHPQAWQAILAQAQQRPPMVMRVNTRRISVSDWLAGCEQAGLLAQPLGGSAVWLPQPVPVQQIPGFEIGECSVQDAVAQLAAPLLLDALGPAPAGQRWQVLDACAAPGGKTAHLLEYADVDVLALDVDSQRMARVQANLQRLGLSARTRVADAARPNTWARAGEMFDGILLDAPCSASGIVRRHPDIAWLRRPEDLATLALQQRVLLEALWSRLKPGGFLLYCTCSVFKAEGEEQVQTFVAHNTDALRKPAPGHLTPSVGGKGASVGDNSQREPDGFFYALLQKAG
ncbi:MAG: 16S rRNA (cytosine(967)-C(5))-methyltransferase RsmB [Alphaproteobacteria bacterium]|nr:16S rRNA (cytosine(967)-C(5))-methyltransferase RsmB [Alphaproteobacteria bacterium]MDI9329954.1 16S rRNA (cytosine(967)-C(5))-methyltransferase RsmB [Alphaproteobacteria bacterium]